MFVFVHEPGQAPEGAAMRRYRGGQRMEVQNLPSGMHISLCEEAEGEPRKSRPTSHGNATEAHVHR